MIFDFQHNKKDLKTDLRAQNASEEQQFTNKHCRYCNSMTFFFKPAEFPTSIISLPFCIFCCQEEAQDTEVRGH